jgi:hypothetical protein
MENRSETTLQLLPAPGPGRKAEDTSEAYLGGGGGVKISRLRPGSGFGFGLGAFLTSLLPLSLFPMGASMPQMRADEKTRLEHGHRRWPDMLRG